MLTCRNLYVLGLAGLLSFTSLSCSTIQEIGRAITNLSRCSFKINSVSDFTLVGIPLSGKTSLSVTDGLKLIPAFRDGRFPASFNLNIAAINPNDGTGGTPRSSATLTSLAWTMLIDNTLTISGDIPSPVTIPGTGQQTIIPLKMDLDLYRFFNNRGYESLLNLALALGGANRSPSRIVLRARPTISTSYGPITYPEEIEIIDKEFRAE